MLAFIDALIVPAALLAALGCGVIGGVFFAFSTFVMQALERLEAHSGLAAMQSINVVVLNPLFLGAFLGSGALCVLLIAGALLRWQMSGAGWLLIGGGLYLVGNVVVTSACNVPLNDALARLDPSAASSAAAWQRYVVEWTRWNHVRTVTALAAAASFIVFLCRCAAARAVA
ncbi:MAG: anthrone oxygenase family protein [bacterium]